MRGPSMRAKRSAGPGNCIGSRKAYERQPSEVTHAQGRRQGKTGRSTALVPLLQAALDQMYEGRCKRQYANDPEDRQQILVNIRNGGAQPITEGRDTNDPEEATENVRLHRIKW